MPFPPSPGGSEEKIGEGVEVGDDDGEEEEDGAEGEEGEVEGMKRVTRKMRKRKKATKGAKNPPPGARQTPCPAWATLCPCAALSGSCGPHAGLAPACPPLRQPHTHTLSNTRSAVTRDAKYRQSRVDGLSVP